MFISILNKHDDSFLKHIKGLQNSGILRFFEKQINLENQNALILFSIT